MRRLFIFILCQFCAFTLLAQNFFISNITNNSVTINYSINEQERVYLFEDTLLYQEDFSNFPIVTGYDIAKTSTSVYLPSSYTNFPNTKGKNIKHTNEGIEFYTTTEFVTPKQNLLQSGMEYKLSCSTTRTGTSSPYDLIVENIETLDTFHIGVSGLTEKIISNPTNNTSFRIYPNNINSNNKYILNNIKITHSPVNLRNYLLSNGTNQVFTINNLQPNTKYCIGINGLDTLPFKTLPDAEISSISNIETDRAELSIENNTSNPTKLILVKKPGALAKDLFISQVVQITSGGASQAIELYNGTGNNLSLADYSIVLQMYSNTGTMQTERIHSFSEKDTIYNNSTFVVMNELYPLNVCNDGIFEYAQNNFFNTFNGNDAIILKHSNDTIDIYGQISEQGVSISSNAWHTPNIQTAGTILKRNSYVTKGVRFNPENDFSTLEEQWIQVGDINTTNEEDFEDFGAHTMLGVLTNEIIKDKNIGEIILENTLTLTDTSYELSNLEENRVYVAYLLSDNGNIMYDHKVFRTKHVVSRNVSGLWNDNNWDDEIPSAQDVAFLNCCDVEIPNGVEANCFNLVLKADSLVQSTIKNNGVLNIGNQTYVEMYYKGFENTDNIFAHYLSSVPVRTSLEDQYQIAQSFDLSVENSYVDLFAWDSYSSESNDLSSWMNWKLNLNNQDFFQTGKAYLVKYKENKLNTFCGEINDETSYTLLSNADYINSNNENSLYLLANPYPFRICVKDIHRENCSLPYVLNEKTGNYEILSMSDTLNQFQGFMSQVFDANNSLTIEKRTSDSITIETQDYTTFTISSVLGEDNLKLLFDTLSTIEFNGETDAHKLFGLGNAPEIYLTLNNENYSIKKLPRNLDTILLDVHFKIKQNNSLCLKYSGENIEGFDKIALFNRSNNELLCDFLQDSLYYFEESGQEDDFYLMFTKQGVSISSVDNIKPYINISQKGKDVEIFSNAEIESILLYNIQGQILSQNKNINKITLPSKGIFFVKVRTTKNDEVFKVVF